MKIMMNRILMSITMQSLTLIEEHEGNEVNFSHIEILAMSQILSYLDIIVFSMYAFS